VEAASEPAVEAEVLAPEYPPPPPPLEEVVEVCDTGAEE
jgi:hypothetical protein